MLLSLVTNKKEIEAYEDRLETELKTRGQAFDEKYHTSENIQCYFLAKFDVSYSRGFKDNRYINHFFRGKSTEGGFQINIPKSGIDRNVQGAFVKLSGAIYLLHRGRRLGGRLKGRNLCDCHGVEKLKIIQHFDDDGETKEGVVIPFLHKKGRFKPDFLGTIREIVDALDLWGR